jgi:glutamyl-Q tRNA(Asp) synthetase
MRQSDRSEAYKRAIDDLTQMKLLYPCFCTRKEILEEINISNNAPHQNNNFGPIYPGICKNLENNKRNAFIESGKPYALRLDTAKAKHIVGDLTWYDRIRGKQIVQVEKIGDVVLARKDIASSYHLAVTIDDAEQGITLINRGNDLFESTHVHRLLQALLNLETPEWQHTALLTDVNGKRLAKRENSLTLRSLRAKGIKGTDVWFEAIKNIASQEKSRIGLKF